MYNVQSSPEGNVHLQQGIPQPVAEQPGVYRSNFSTGENLPDSQLTQQELDLREAANRTNAAAQRLGGLALGEAVGMAKVPGNNTEYQTDEPFTYRGLTSEQYADNYKSWLSNFDLQKQIIMSKTHEDDQRLELGPDEDDKGNHPRGTKRKKLSLAA